ncbi:MAG: hypothetical protein A2431_01770 [Candidatus Zambryskibacteria bacterium RIFOXYC1_FULL_39_10]|uniref:Uncharacterized protein n=1 Tax=Candidatus Zambryskibacteria bacterium RIFOXYC1_FULL_39_10 TaxID=1802779 RepID=A0A1G2V442_9BACT|nr:MAG: hypothetical protein A2605_02960 [Candidatus Zambryskibacteria bacterium RIFOXYD1_FULL_39_35]OHB16407.1 MAG: hypothetical protein A2431_01770 [Candidatus Zambryskibacteria bacterium RIFOXYC1_FULL_39_10]
MSALFKKIIASLILVSFMSLLIFGIFTMIHNSDGQMLGQCPFSVADTSDCVQNTVASAIHYISSYQSFINVTIDYGLTILLASLFIFASVFLILFTGQNIFKYITFIKNRFYDYSPVFSSTRKIIHWLSLFENSPTIV